MRIKILYVCFTLSFFINIALCIHLLKREPVCGHIHLDEIDRTRDVVPNERTAKKIAEILVGIGETKTGSGKNGNIAYDCQVFLHKPSYEWIVFFYARTQEGEPYMDGVQTVWIRRDYGTIVNYCR